jgi:hypothetical protein
MRPSDTPALRNAVSTTASIGCGPQT